DPGASSAVLYSLDPADKPQDDEHQRPGTNKEIRRPAACPRDPGASSMVLGSRDQVAGRDHLGVPLRNDMPRVFEKLQDPIHIPSSSSFNFSKSSPNFSSDLPPNSGSSVISPLNFFSSPSSSASPLPLLTPNP